MPPCKHPDTKLKSSEKTLLYLTFCLRSTNVSVIISKNSQVIPDFLKVDYDKYCQKI